MRRYFQEQNLYLFGQTQSSEPNDTGGTGVVYKVWKSEVSPTFFETEGTDG